MNWERTDGSAMGGNHGELGGRGEAPAEGVRQDQGALGKAGETWRNMEKPSTMEFHMFHGPGASKNSSKADILIFITLPPSFRKFQFHLWSIPKLLVKIRWGAPKLVSNNLSDRPLLYLTSIQLKLFFRFINHHQPPFLGDYSSSLMILGKTWEDLVGLLTSHWTFAA